VNEKYAYYSNIVGSVETTIAKIRDLPMSRCYDTHYIEHQLIPDLGLNDEYLEQQPSEFSPYFGKGLHLWQYPSQLARYLVWLSHNARTIRNYTEIGCRWGGTFILVNEWLKKIGAPIEFSLAVDPIEPTPFVQRYIEVSSTPVHYIQNFSSSKDVMDYLAILKPDMVFIDGDHSLQGVMFDHLLVRNSGKIIVHHDVASQACPGTTVFWSYVKQAESDFEAFEFSQQYDSVDGNFLGIGVLKRK
jgi:cephalosporin hydroxylase